MHIYMDYIVSWWVCPGAQVCACLRIHSRTEMLRVQIQERLHVNARKFYEISRKWIEATKSKLTLLLGQFCQPFLQMQWNH